MSCVGLWRKWGTAGRVGVVGRGQELFWRGRYGTEGMVKFGLDRFGRLGVFRSGELRKGGEWQVWHGR